MENIASEAYLRRCHRKLNELEAPLEGWFCARVVDFEKDKFTCESVQAVKEYGMYM